VVGGLTLTVVQWAWRPFATCYTHAGELLLLRIPLLCGARRLMTSVSTFLPVGAYRLILTRAIYLHPRLRVTTWLPLREHLLQE
jgi:hypothetical protein